PDRLVVENRSLKQCILTAYSVKTFQVFGGPGWIGSDAYDITAKAPGRSDYPQLLQMLQSLLEDCFQLQFHRETKEIRGYRLTLRRPTPLFHETPTSDPRPALFLTRDDEFSGPKVSMAYFANYLSRILTAPVLDATGLNAKYDITLHF